MFFLGQYDYWHQCQVSRPSYHQKSCQWCYSWNTNLDRCVNSTHEDLILSPPTRWKFIRYSMFDGMSYNNVGNSWLGTLPDKLPRYQSRYVPTTSRIGLTSFDSHAKWPGKIGPIVNQAGFGASWAVSAVTTMADRLNICYNYSHRIELDWCKLTKNKCDYSNNCARKQRDAWTHLNQLGTTVIDCHFSNTCHLTFKTWYWLMSQNIEDIKNEIEAHGPVQARLKIYSDFLFYGSGVYR